MIKLFDQSLVRQRIDCANSQWKIHGENFMQNLRNSGITNTMHLFGTQSHMKFCPYHHAYLDHGSDVACLTDVSHLVLLSV